MLKSITIAYKIFLTGFIFSSLFFSCKPTSKELAVFYDKPFTEIETLAKQEEKLFCIVLSRPDCPPCGSFIQSLGERYGHLASKVMFNVVDVSLSEHQWYPQWLCTGAFPTTCVFSAGGVLKAVIPGSVTSSKQCIESVISGDVKCANYFTNPVFPMSNENSLTALNALLSCKQNLDRGNDISDEIQPLLEQNAYPYCLFLKLSNEERQGRHEEAVYWAERMISPVNPYYSFVYDALYHEAKVIINPNYAAEASELSVVDELTLDGCRYKESKPFSLTLTNKGKSPLCVRDISVSCTCLKLLSEKQLTLEPGKSARVDLMFTPDVRGDVFREVVFFSDAKNSMQRVRVLAVVK